MTKQKTSVPIDTYGNDLTGVIQERRRKMLLRKAYAEMRYLRQYARRMVYTTDALRGAKRRATERTAELNCV